MALSVYLNFKGNCREAVDFYSEAFGVAKQKIMTFGEAPPNPEFPLSEETKNMVMHTFLNIKGSNVMLSDVPEGMPFNVGNNISLIVTNNDVEEIKSIFNKLKAGGTIHMDLQETFWSKCYGFVIDKFGIGWQLSYENSENGM